MCVLPGTGLPLGLLTALLTCHMQVCLQVVSEVMSRDLRLEVDPEVMLAAAAAGKR